MDRLESQLSLEGYNRIVGIDEAGRGPLAGPVVAAALIIKKPLPLNLGIRDSKTLSPAKRERLVFNIFHHSVSVGLGISWHDEVDNINIHNASLRAMERAVTRLSLSPDFLLIDGKFPINSKTPQRAVVRGDSLSISIAAASIVAKTARDRIMASYERLYPGYGFSRHKGYGTKKHIEAIEKLGPCPVHRLTFSPLSFRKKKVRKENR